MFEIDYSFGGSTGAARVAADLTNLEATVKTDLSRALNAAVRTGRAAAVREMKKQVNFPARYLSSTANGRLSITKRASGSSLEAIITGRRRPTSLARFARGFSRKRGSVRVEVKPGRVVSMKRAFYVGLRSGQGAGGNVGLAVRTSGGPPPGAYKPKNIFKNVWLLYGPSVDQVFKTVRQDVTPVILKKAEAEFVRLQNLRDKT